MSGGRLAKAFFILFVLLLVWPFIGLADVAASVLGVPALLLYTFVAWGALVCVLAAVARRMED